MRAAAEPNKAIKDDLYRVTSATNTSTPAESQTWQYDEIGRITNNSRVGNYAYPNAGQPRPHAPLTAGTHSFTNYDSNGNLVVGAGRTMSWDANNQITQATVGATTTTFTYDADGERLKKTTGASTTRYPFGGDYEIAPNGDLTKYISVYRLGVVAKRVTTGGSTATYWLHTDQLGSIQAETDISGAVSPGRRAYRPYGETLSDSMGTAESRGWIDQRNDSETGLTYLHARYYDPMLATFVSPDPIGVEGGLNAYGYGPSDPINGADRSGLMWRICTIGDIVGWCWEGPLNGEPRPPIPPRPPPSDRNPREPREPREPNPTPGVPTPVPAPAPDCNLSNTCGEEPPEDCSVTGTCQQPTQPQGTPAAGTTGKGERGTTAKPEGTANPFKGMKPHPTDPKKVIFTDPHTGKKFEKAKPPGFQPYWDAKHPSERGRGPGGPGGPTGGIPPLGVPPGAGTVVPIIIFDPCLITRGRFPGCTA